MYPCDVDISNAINPGNQESNCRQFQNDSHGAWRRYSVCLLNNFCPIHPA